MLVLSHYIHIIYTRQSNLYSYTFTYNIAHLIIHQKPEIQDACQTRHRNRTVAGRGTVADIFDEVQSKFHKLSVGNRQTTTERNAKSDYRSHRIRQHGE